MRHYTVSVLFFPVHCLVICAGKIQRHNGGLLPWEHQGGKHIHTMTHVGGGGTWGGGDGCEGSSSAACGFNFVMFFVSR